MSALQNLLLRTVINASYTTKGAVLSFEELDNNLILLAEAIQEAGGGNTAGILPYDPLTEYSANNGLDSFVTFENNTWEYINPVPSTGNAPDIEDNTFWEITSSGAFTHAQNTDTGTNSNSFGIGDGLDSEKSIVFDGVNAKIIYNIVADVLEAEIAGVRYQLTTHDKIQNSSFVYDELPIGTVDAIDVTLVPAPLAYVDGMIVKFKAIGTNTGAATIDVNGLGVTSILRNDGMALQAADIEIDGIYILMYDGLDFRIINVPVTRIVRKNDLSQILNFIDLTTFKYTQAENYRITEVNTEPGVTATIKIGGTATNYVLGDTVNAWDELDITVDVTGSIQLKGNII